MTMDTHKCTYGQLLLRSLPSLLSIIYVLLVAAVRSIAATTEPGSTTAPATHSYKAAASHQGTLSSKQNFELHSLRCMIPTRRMFYRDGDRVAFSSFKLVMRARPAEKTKISDSSLSC